MNYNFCVYIEKKQRVDMYLSALFGQLSRSYIQKMIDTGCIRVNGMQVKKNLKLTPKDEVSIIELISSVELVAENIPLEIIYEDENICVINKDAGINVHPTPGVEGKKGTLVNALLYHCKNKLPVISGEERPGIVHRLDKDTSGVILTAKNDTYMRLLSEKIKNREVKKYYIAVVAGIFPEKSFTITSDIGRHRTDRTRMTTKDPLNPKHAVTHGERIAVIHDTYSVLKIDLETGRTHQIRVHLSSIGYPIIGDKVYGNSEMNSKACKDFGLERQALHAFQFSIDLYGQKRIFIADLKADMKHICQGISLV